MQDPLGVQDGWGQSLEMLGCRSGRGPGDGRDVGNFHSQVASSQDSFLGSPMAQGDTVANPRLGHESAAQVAQCGTGAKPTNPVACVATSGKACKAVGLLPKGTI